MKKSKSLILLCMAALVLGGCDITTGNTTTSSSESSETSESSGEKQQEEACAYAIIGDLEDSSWDVSPLTTSKYYIAPNTEQYKVEITLTEGARFRVVEYGTYNLAIGYDELDPSSSEGLVEGSSKNIVGIEGATYSLDISLGENKSILVTYISGGDSSLEDPGQGLTKGAYALYGDFADASWEGFPEEGSPYRLEYTVGDDSTKYWTREVTIAEAPTSTDDWLEYGAWAAGFRVADVYWDAVSEENIWTTIAGYSALSSASTGVENYTDNENNIKLYYWGATYTLTIDLRDSLNPSIIVTYLSGGTHYEVGSTGEESGSGEEEYDAYYSLVGDFADSSWNGWPEQDSIYYLAYDSTDKSTMYWEVTVTMAEAPDFGSWTPWNAGLRVAHVYYDENYTWTDDEGTHTGGDVWDTVVGYQNIDSNSTGVLGEGSDDNIAVNWETTYDLVIDMRGATPSILVTLVEDGGDSGNTGDDDEPGSGVSYDSNYVLTGDFIDASWDGWPSEDSAYYLGYNSNDDSTKYWERTVTIATEPTDNEWWDPDSNTWNASFYVASVTWNGLEGDESEDDWTLVCGYTYLASGSTGVLGASGDGGIEVSWGATYDLVIDMRGTTPSILVTEVVDTGDSGSTGGSTQETIPDDYNPTSYYYLSGNFSGASWTIPSSTSSTYALPYDTKYDDSLYWQRTITTESAVTGTEYPGFRVVTSSWEDVANFTNLTIDSSSTGVAWGYTDGNNNIKLDSWNTTYDLTIDMRGTNWSILINYHQDGFDGEKNGLFDGLADNTTASDYEALNVSDDYLMGMDISSLAEVENAGGKFYNEAGEETDLIELLADQGINCVRLRLWVDPTDENGNSYQGGGNDLDTDLAIAKRCAEKNISICLDLHYSDFWAHHGQQFVPKSWTSYSEETLYSAASEWTKSTINSFISEGVDIAMVQVGNETNGNYICGAYDTTFFKNCAAAVKEVSQNIKVVIHYSMDQNTTTYTNNFNALISAGCSFDVLGLSYYPYFHGSISDFKNTLTSLSSSFSTKEICLMEYSYGWTTSSPYGDKYGSVTNTFNADYAAEGGYDASVAGQTKCIYEINEVVASLSNGIGTFYWEPAWLSVSGTSWASSYAAPYYSANNVAFSGADTTTWSNQALFDFDGKALDSLNIYGAMLGK